ncbi:MAG: translation initiation factor IF-3 [Elusimicrobia bacterium HGW-Elusimicrobia-4]|nr:MAG: translation initiation factor IF-3 [Elusimicrobia bacterium HGW-Elusimicrobia-4]
MSKSFLRINSQIRAPKVRLIGEDGTQLGEKTIQEAMFLARETGVDLVEIAPMATPPVCKIIDYKKYKYLQSKKTKTVHKTGVLKEIKIRPKIGEHDLAVKIKHILRFLEEKNKVKVLMQFFGREREHISVGGDIINRLLAEVSEYGQPDSPPRLMGNSINVILSPKK